MIIPFKLPNPQQHDRIYLEEAITRYSQRMISAKGFIYTILKIYRAKGQKLSIPRARDFYTYFAIPKTTFYRALSELENTPDLNFHWQPTGGIAMWYGAREEEEEEEEEEEVAEKVEKQAAKYNRLKEIPAHIRTDFEKFVREQWRKIKGEEIRSFHRFLEKPADFQNWWQKFQNQGISIATPATTTAPTDAEPRRTFTPFPAALKGKSPFSKKPT
jgi:hypothetical protein